jgi:hypothetical protein
MSSTTDDDHLRRPGRLGLGCPDESEVPGVLVVEAARHPAAQLQPVLLTSCTITLVYLPAHSRPGPERRASCAGLAVIAAAARKLPVDEPGNP